MLHNNDLIKSTRIKLFVLIPVFIYCFVLILFLGYYEPKHDNEILEIWVLLFFLSYLFGTLTVFIYQYLSKIDRIETKNYNRYIKDQLEPVQSNKTGPFNIKDIDGVSVIIHAKDKKYAIVKKEGRNSEECKQERIGYLWLLLESHAVVTPAITDLNKSNIELALKTKKDE